MLRAILQLLRGAVGQGGHGSILKVKRGADSRNALPNVVLVGADDQDVNITLWSGCTFGDRTVDHQGFNITVELFPDPLTEGL